MALAAGGLLYFLLVSVLDHWLVSGGLGFWGRLACLAVFLAGAGWFVVRRLGPLLIRRINPVYAAETIEKSKPSLKNALINFLFLRGDRSGVPQVVFQAVEEQAASSLQRTPVEATVDRTKVIQIGYVLLAIVAIFAAYKLFSPKDPLETFQRVVMPWADIQAPTRVTIVDVSPGDATKYLGEAVEVSAEVRGVGADEPVRILYTTADQGTVDQAVVMYRAADSFRHTGKIPSGEAGLQQDIEYRIEAGDAVSPTYHLKAAAAPTITVESIDYEFPAYMERAKAHVENTGDIQAYEGTIVTIHGRANQPLKSAQLVLDGGDNRHQEIALAPMKSDRRNVAAKFTLKLNEGDHSPEFSRYQLRPDGRAKPEPAQYKIDVFADLPPEIKFLAPEKDEMTVPVNGSVQLELRAHDPDFALSEVTLSANVDDKQIVNKKLLSERHPGPLLSKFRFQPAKLGLKEGDTVSYWAAAKDNRTPIANEAHTPHRLIRIVKAEQRRASNEPAANDAKENPDPNANPNDDNAKPKDDEHPNHNPKDANNNPTPDAQNPNNPDNKQNNNDNAKRIPAATIGRKTNPTTGINRKTTDTINRNPTAASRARNRPAAMAVKRTKSRTATIPAARRNKTPARAATRRRAALRKPVSLAATQRRGINRTINNRPIKRAIRLVAVNRTAHSKTVRSRTANSQATRRAAINPTPVSPRAGNRATSRLKDNLSRTAPTPANLPTEATAANSNRRTTRPALRRRPKLCDKPSPSKIRIRAAIQANNPISSRDSRPANSQGSREPMDNRRTAAGPAIKPRTAHRRTHRPIRREAAALRRMVNQEREPRREIRSHQVQIRNPVTSKTDRKTRRIIRADRNPTAIKRPRAINPAKPATGRAMVKKELRRNSLGLTPIAMVRSRTNRPAIKTPATSHIRAASRNPATSRNLTVRQIHQTSRSLAIRLNPETKRKTSRRTGRIRNREIHRIKAPSSRRRSPATRPSPAMPVNPAMPTSPAKRPIRTAPDSSRQLTSETATARTAKTRPANRTRRSKATVRKPSKVRSPAIKSAINRRTAASSSPMPRGAIRKERKANRDRVNRTTTRTAPPVRKKGTSRTNTRTTPTAANRRRNPIPATTRSLPATAPRNPIPRDRKAEINPAAGNRVPDKAPIKPAPAAPARTPPPMKVRARPRAPARERIRASPAPTNNPTKPLGNPAIKRAMAPEHPTSQLMTAHGRASLGTNLKAAAAPTGLAAIASASFPTARRPTPAQSMETRPTWISPASNSISRSIA